MNVYRGTWSHRLREKGYSRSICICTLEQYRELSWPWRWGNHDLWIYGYKSIWSLDQSFCSRFLWCFSSSNTVYFCFFLKRGAQWAGKCPSSRVILARNTFKSIIRVIVMKTRQNHNFYCKSAYFLRLYFQLRTTWYSLIQLILLYRFTKLFPLVLLLQR